MDDHTVLWKATSERGLCVWILLLPEDGYDQNPKHAGALFVIKLVQVLDNKLVYKLINVCVCACVCVFMFYVRRIVTGFIENTGRPRFAPGIRSLKTSHKSNTQFSFKTVHFLGVWGLSASSYVQYYFTTSGHTVPYSIYVLYVQCKYIYVQHIYLFMVQRNCKRLISIFFGTAHSERVVVALLHKHCKSWLSTLCGSIGIISHCKYAAMSKSNITPYAYYFTNIKSDNCV
jgi:hypothetical protein